MPCAVREVRMGPDLVGIAYLLTYLLTYLVGIVARGVVFVANQKLDDFFAAIEVDILDPGAGG